MKSISELIAATKPESEPKPMGPFAAVAFVAVLLVGASAAAYWIGTSIAREPAAPTMAYTEVEPGFGF